MAAKSISINRCEDCPFKGHTGGFTKGGAKPCCDHAETVKLKGPNCFDRTIPHDGQTKRTKRIPKWCPL